jgi:hypothetical protein
MLGRLIEVYPTMDYATQSYSVGRYPSGYNGRVLDHIWENSTINLCARCYDAVYDAIDADDDLKTYLAARGIADLKREFEQEVLHFMAQDVMAGRIKGNMYYQPTLARLAIVIDNEDPAYGSTTDEMVDWLLYGGGEVELILFNGFDRDGAGGESAPGYSSAWNTNFCRVADLLIRLGYDVTANPRWRQVIRFPDNLTIAGGYSPRIGDCGGDIHRAKKLVNNVVASFGYRHFRDPQCAQLLLDQESMYKRTLWGDELDRADVERVANRSPDMTDLRTRNLGGYGLAVFDAGEGAARRGAWIYYGGANAWHGHHDRLTIGYTGHGRDFLTEMGYPAHWDAIGDRFVRGMPSHYIVEIDQRRSTNKKSGYLDFFAASPGGGTGTVRVARAHGESVYPGLANLYERTIAMIDSGKESFLIDQFRIKGGSLHDYHFHGLPFGEFTTSGLDLVSQQEQGTLLGVEIPWGGDESKDGSGYDFLRNVRRFTAKDVWSARWVGRDDCRLAYWMPAFSEVIVCDGEPPAKPDYPDSMEFVVVRDRGSASRFPAVIAPSRGADLVSAASFEDLGDGTRCHVETADGVWAVVVKDNGAFTAECNRLDGSAYAYFANQIRVNFGSQTLRAKQVPTFTVRAVDYEKNVIETVESIRRPKALIGEVAIITGNGYSASYTVADAGRKRIQLAGTSITGMIVVDSVGSNVLTTKTRLSGYGTQLTARRFDLMALIDEDFRNPIPIAGYSSPEGVATFALYPALPGNAASFPDANGDGRRTAYLADFAPGYTVTFTPWIEAESRRPGELELRSNVPLETPSPAERPESGPFGQASSPATR